MVSPLDLPGLLVGLWDALTAIPPKAAVAVLVIIFLAALTIGKKDHEKLLEHGRTLTRHGRTLYGDEEDPQQTGITQDVHDVSQRIDRVEEKVDDISRRLDDVQQSVQNIESALDD